MVGIATQLTVSDEKDYVRIRWFDPRATEDWRQYEPDRQEIAKLPENKQFQPGCKVKDVNSNQTGVVITIQRLNTANEGPLVILWDGMEEAQKGWFFNEVDKTAPGGNPTAPKIVSRYVLKLRVGDVVQKAPQVDAARWTNAETGKLMVGKVTAIEGNTITVELEAEPKDAGSDQDTPHANIQDFIYESNIKELQVIPGIERPALSALPGAAVITRWPEIDTGDLVTRGPDFPEDDVSDLWMSGDEREPRNEAERELAIKALGVVYDVEDHNDDNDGWVILVKWGTSDTPDSFDRGAIESTPHRYVYRDGNHEVQLVRRESTGEILENGGVVTETPVEPPGDIARAASFELIDTFDGAGCQFRATIENTEEDPLTYSIQRGYLEGHGCGNGAIASLVFDDSREALEAITQAYGYTPVGAQASFVEDWSSWPEYTPGDWNAVKAVLRMLVERGVIITKYEEDEEDEENHEEEYDEDD